jgi:hypothetical protein
VTIRATLLLVSVIARSSAALAQQSAPPEPERHLVLNWLGFERFHNRVLVADRRELWSGFWCDQRPGDPATCRVTIVRLEGCVLHWPYVIESDFTSADGSLNVTALDWEKGRVTFTLKFPDHVSSCSLDFTSGKADLVRNASCSYTEERSGSQAVVVENRLPAKSYEFRPPCGYWLLGQDNKLQPLPAP